MFLCLKIIEEDLQYFSANPLSEMLASLLHLWLQTGYSVTLLGLHHSPVSYSTLYVLLNLFQWNAEGSRGIVLKFLAELNRKE